MRVTHKLENTEGVVDQGSKRKRASEEHSPTGECRVRDKSE